jgi:hypothetical protein
MHSSSVAQSTSSATMCSAAEPVGFFVQLREGDGPVDAGLEDPRVLAQRAVQRGGATGLREAQFLEHGQRGEQRFVRIDGARHRLRIARSEVACLVGEVHQGLDAQHMNRQQGAFAGEPRLDARAFVHALAKARDQRRPGVLVRTGLRAPSLAQGRGRRPPRVAAFARVQSRQHRVAPGGRGEVVEAPARLGGRREHEPRTGIVALLAAAQVLDAQGLQRTARGRLRLRAQVPMGELDAHGDGDGEEEESTKHPGPTKLLAGTAHAVMIRRGLRIIHRDRRFAARARLSRPSRSCRGTTGSSGTLPAFGARDPRSG